jgi:hypothetical protein
VVRGGDYAVKDSGSSETDSHSHVVDLILDTLGEGEARGKIVESIAGFYQSNVLKDLPWSLLEEVSGR